MHSMVSRMDAEAHVWHRNSVRVNNVLCTGTAPAFSEFGSSVRVCCGGCMSKKFVHSQWTNKRPCVFEWFRVLLSQD